MMPSPNDQPPPPRFPAALPPILQAAFWMVLSALSFGCMSLLVRAVADEVHPFEAAFFRSLFGLVWIAPMLARYGRPSLMGGRRRSYLLRSSFSVTALLASFYALAHMPIADTIALSFTGPLFATIGAALFLGETVRLRRWSATLVGFLGVLVIVQPGQETLQPAALAVLLSAAASAGAMLTVRSLSRTEHPNAIVAGMALYLTPLSLVPALFVWTWPSWTALGWMALLGLFGTLAQLTVTRALAAAETSLVVPFDYLRLPIGALAAFLVFGEVPTAWSFVGTAVIAASSLYIARREAYLTRKGLR